VLAFGFCVSSEPWLKVGPVAGALLIFFPPISFQLPTARLAILHRFSWMTVYSEAIPIRMSLWERRWDLSQLAKVRNFSA
jgi:hypothetical protein